MGEYIEREAAVAISSYAEDEHPYKKLGTPETYSKYNEGWSDACDYIRGKMESTPGADVDPVKHGIWLKTIMDDYECSNCLYPMDYITPFCPRCGAKMDGKEESE